MAAKRKRGILLLIIGASLGVATGLCFRLLERYLVGEIVELMRDEATAACSCSLEYDSLRLSLFTLKGVAKGVRMTSNGKDVLNFEKITVYASLRNILSREIILSRLVLSHGLARGVSESSPTFRFIDQLSTPLPPEQQNPNRLKAKLLRLEVENSYFVEELGNFELIGSQLNLAMERNQQDQFTLYPKIGRLALVSSQADLSPEFKHIDLGAITGEMTIEEVTIAYRSFQLALNSSLFNLAGSSKTTQANALSGNAQGVLDLEDVPGLPLTTGKIRLDGSLQGTLGRPLVPATVSLTAPQQIVIGPAEAPYLIFDQLSGDLVVNGQERPPSLQIEHMTLSGEEKSATIVKPVYIGDSAFRGLVNLDAAAIPFSSGVVVRRIKASIELGGNPKLPIYTINGSGDLGIGEALEFKDIQFRIIVRDQDLDFEAWRNRAHSFGAEKFFAKGHVDNFAQDQRSGKDIQLEAENVLLTDPLVQTKGLVVSGTTKLSGGLNRNQLQAVGNLTVTPVIRGVELPLSTQLSIEGGKLTLAGVSADNSIQANLRLDLANQQKNSLELQTNKFAIEKIFPSLSCITNSATLKYDFIANAFMQGSGQIELADFSLGCPPYGLSLTKATILPISRGVLSLAPLTLTNQLSKIDFSGGISFEKGFEFAAESKLKLESLLGLVRSIDDLEGDVSARLMLRGPFAQPKMTGNVELKNALFSFESIDVAGAHINGGLNIDNNSMSFKNFSGDLNGGRFSINGSLAPFEKRASDFVFELKNILVEPKPGVSALWSGVFRLGSPEGALPSLKGDIEIHSAELRQQVDLVTILKAVRESVSTRVANSQAFSKVPFGALDLSIAIPGNFLLLSNWASAELSGNLHIRGEPANPVIEGTIETLSGWFGFKNRQFQITSGKLIFSPLSQTPEIDLLSETLVRSYLGDNVFMVLEAKGPIDNPRIRLASDSGLTERDLLSLLTTGQSPTKQNLLSRRGYGFSLEDRPLIDPTRPFSLSEFFQDLTRIDVLSIEPTFNARTGAVEPAFSAQRKLTEDISIFAQNSFGNGSSDSEAGLSLALADSLALIGGVESSSARQNNALTVDLSYTILAAQHVFVHIAFEGVVSLSTSEMLRHLRLSSASRVRSKDLERLSSSLEALYRDRGFFSSSVEISCEEKDGYCHTLKFTVTEEARSKIARVVFSGETLPFISVEQSEKEVKGLIASREVLENEQKLLMGRLRKEGYIGARVNLLYQPVEASVDVELVVDIAPGRPVTFVFIGNKEYTTEDLLKTIDLFGRKQPFGSNTINILVDNIERKYREAGYLYAAISFRKGFDEKSQRVVYTINIQEEEQAKVSQVIFEGLASLSESELKEIVRRDYASFAEQIFSPKYPLEEEVANNADILKSLYVSQGYPGTKVSYEILPEERSSNVRIVYRIAEGMSQRRKWLLLDGIDNQEVSLSLPETPYTIPDANRIIIELLEKFQDLGYLAPALQSARAGSGPAPIRLSIHKGEKTTINEIQFEGLQTVNQTVVIKELLVAKGSAWSAKQIDESRRRLFKLGLFSQIETFPADGELDSANEILVFRFTERPLTTLGVGAGANSAFGLHLFGEAIDRSLLADGRLISLRFDTYYDPSSAEVTQGTANLRYLDPSFYSDNIVFTEDLRYQNLQRSTQEFDLNRVSLSTSLQRTFKEWPTLVLGHTILSEELTNVPEDSIIGDFDTGNVRLGFISGTAIYDRRDNPFNPRSGYSLNADFRVAAQAFGSEAEYLSTGTGASTVIPLAPLSDRLSFAHHARFASAWTASNTDQIPISQRFYLGGRSSVRGFRENQLGPRGDQGDIIGGDMLFLASSELQYLMYDLLSLHLFFDTGNVFLKSQSTGISDLRQGTGVGFRYRSPVGPIGFDVGTPIDERPGEPSVRVHFSVGSSF
jgi:outer membrane protein insertion porin family